jgi:predicted PurR-regulated permease PerM
MPLAGGIRRAARDLLTGVSMLWLLEDRHGPSEVGRSDQPGNAPVPAGLALLTLLCLIGAIATLVPFWPSLIVASWVAALTAPMLDRLAPSNASRQRYVALLVTAIVIVVVAGLAGVTISLLQAGADLVRTLLATESGSAALRALIWNGSPQHVDLFHLRPEELAGMVRQYGSSALTGFALVFGETTKAIVGALVFICATYFLLTHGKRAYGWVADYALVPPHILRRFATAYIETGRGLLIGIGLTALLQALVATIGYVVLGVSRPAALGFLTFLAALVPTFGTSLVWVPVTVALLLSGRPAAAAVMLVFGLIAGIVDNVARPWLSRWGRLKLPGLVVFIAMLGGLAAFGAWGLILGPLFVRLMVEALGLLREYRAQKPLGLESDSGTS